MAALICAAMWTGGAAAAAYPDRPIKLVVPFPPGGTTDVLGRIFGQYLSQKLGGTVVVENKPGAASALGIDDVAKSAPDGYTLLWGPSDGLAVLPAVRSNMPYQPLTDFTPLGLVAKAPFAFAVKADFAAQDIKGLVAYAKQHPGGLNFGTPGIGSAGHLTTALLELRAGIKLTHVPYKGGAQAINDVMAGQIQMITASPTALVSFAQAGKLRMLAQTGKTRIALASDVPTMIEAGFPGFVAESWFGVFGPKALPADIAAKLMQAITATQGNPEVVSQFNKVGVIPADVPVAEVPAFLASNLKFWSDIAAKADIHVSQ